MSGAGRYAELASAVRSFKAGLIQASQIERMTEVGTLSETVSLLTDGSITTTDVSDIISAESYLIQKMSAITDRLASYAPHDSRPLIKLFKAWHELACAKEILKSIGDQVEPEEVLRHIVPAGRLTLERCKELIESRNPNRVIETLGIEWLKNAVTPKLTGEGGVMAAVAAIDQYYYQNLWSASNLPDPLDAQSARGLVGELIDRVNILLALRARLFALDARSTSDMMVPVNYGLGHSFSEMTEATNVQNLMRVLDKTPYSQSLQAPGLMDNLPAGVELALNRSHATSCLNAFAGSPFNIGLALAFLFLKNYELHDFFSIINGKANNVPADRVMPLLILRRD